MRSITGGISRQFSTRASVRKALAVLVVAQFGAGLAVVAGSGAPSLDASARRIGAAAPIAVPDAGGPGEAVPAAVPTTVVPETTAAPAPPPTTAAPPPTTAAPPPPANEVVAAPRGDAAKKAAGVATFKGLGTWVDVYDWSTTYTKGNPGFLPEHVDAVAAEGVQTLYLQLSKWDSPTGDVLEPERLMAIIDRAHQRGIKVSGWYLPTLVDPTADINRMVALTKLPIDSFGVDIEATNVADPAERSRRLVAESAALRAAAPDLAIAAIVLPPIVIEDLNQKYWPNFPWKAIHPSYDAWIPMSYWTNRKASSGLRDAYTYTFENARRVRVDLGDPNALIHVVGGIGDQSSPADMTAFRKAAVAVGAIGGSIYDWRTMRAELWPPLKAFRG